jgi:hypothetical protein
VINKLSISTFMVIMLMLLAFPARAQEVDLFTIPLQKCSKVLDSAEKAFQSVDVSTLPVQYRRGVFIEKTRTRALKYVGMARKDVERLKKQPTVSGVLILVTDLRSLETDTEHITTLLLQVLANSGDQQQTVTKWIATFSKVSDKLSEAVDDYEDAAHIFAQRIDDKLERCR